MLIRVVNLLKKPWKNAIVELFDVSNKDKKTRIEKTDLNGIANFNRKTKGKYLARIYAGNAVFEEIVHGLKHLTNIKLNTIIGFLEKEKLVSDNKFCTYCKFQYDDIVDVFKCHYCGSKHCSKHRLPENHSCPGLPKKPQARFREAHAGKKIYVESDY